MQRVYLEEDMRLIRRYFPGAKTIALRTPFDLTVAPEDPWRLRSDTFNEAAMLEQYGDLLWNR